MQLNSVQKDNRLYIGTFIFLMIYWWLFLCSERPLISLDWYAIQSWLNVWKVSLEQNQLPYYVKMFEGEELWGSRFFAMPYIIASPHVLLLKFISVRFFIYLHVLISTAIGFWGIVKFRKHFKLSDSSFLTLVLFFFLGGFCTDRISVGHIQNAYYLCVPAFLWLLYRFFQSPPGLNRSIVFALFLFTGLLQGSLHVVHQFIFVLMVFALFNPKHLGHALLVVLLFMILSAYFIVPNLFFSTYNEVARHVFGGYGYASGDSMPLKLNNSFLTVTHLGFLISVVSHFVFAFFKTYSPAHNAVWEYAIYSSPFILYYLYLCRNKINKSSLLRHQRNIYPVGLLAIFSIGYCMPVLYMIIEKITMGKFPVIDRLPSRIFFYPLSIIVLYAVISNNSKIRLWHVALSAIYLLYNSYCWRVDKVLQLPVADDIKLKTEILSPTVVSFEQNYLSAVHYSYLFTMVMVLLATGWLYYSRKKENHVQSFL